ncbi:MAG: restriction endonuclease subunit S, partial [Nitrospira sp.]
MKQEWQSKTLGEICVVDWGNTDLTKSAYVEDGKYLAVSAAGCDGRIGHKEHQKHTPVLSAIGAQCGRMFLPEEDFTAIKNTITLTPRDGICTGRFLYQLLTHVELPKRGAAQPFISKGDIQTFQVSVPPLSEQHRIVGILDEAFDGLAKATANAEQNLRNARALFESHHHSIFSCRRKGWDEKTLGNVCEYVNGKAHEQCIDADGRFIVINSKFISSDGEVIKKSNQALLPLQPGEIAMVLSDVPNGKALAKCFLVERANTYTLNQRICLIRSKNFHTKFLFYQLNRNRHFLGFDNGENQTNLRLNQVLSCPLFLPPAAEQEAIASNLDATFTET